MDHAHHAGVGASMVPFAVAIWPALVAVGASPVTATVATALLGPLLRVVVLDLVRPAVLARLGRKVTPTSQEQQ